MRSNKDNLNPKNYKPGEIVYFPPDRLQSEGYYSTREKLLIAFCIAGYLSVFIFTGLVLAGFIDL